MNSGLVRTGVSWLGEEELSGEAGEVELCLAMLCCAALQTPTALGQRRMAAPWSCTQKRQVGQGADVNA